MKRLGIIVPVALDRSSDALYVARFYKNALLILSVPLRHRRYSRPFTGEYLSALASAGFIALVLCRWSSLSINQLRRKVMVFRGDCGRRMLRLRPILMTALTTVLGLIPLLISQGTGSEVQRSLAIVVVFGLISSTFLTLVLIPTIYEWFMYQRTEKVS